MDRPRLKKTLVVTAVLVALPLLLVTLASTLISQDTLVAGMVAQITATTGATVQPGEVSLKVAGGLGLTLDQGRIFGNGTELVRRTGTGQDLGAYDLTYSQLDVSLNLRALLRRQIEVVRHRETGFRRA